MGEPLPTVLVPGLNCSARLYAEQIPALWRFGPLLIADHTRDDSMGAIAARILNAAPPRFALMGLSMGGYIALEIMSQAPARVAKLALLDTGARADTPEQTERRHRQIELAQTGPLCRGTRVAVSAARPPQPSRRCEVERDQSADGARYRAGSVRAPAAGDHTAGRPTP
jgi:pimeloyl-ACP methyl ester carboxylesterase